MAIELISKIKQKNNGRFFLIDLADIDYNSGNATSSYPETSLENFLKAIPSTNIIHGEDKQTLSAVLDSTLKEVDATLTKEGIAADAKATGDAIAKVDAKLFIGTTEEYNIAYNAGLIAVGTVVIITDDEDEPNDDGSNSSPDSSLTTSALGYAILGQMILA